MEFKIVPPEIDFTWLQVEVNGTHDIYLQFTAMGSTRVQLCEKDAPTMDFNWCAGPSILHVWNLVNAMLYAIERKETWLLPFASNPKPYFKDQNFCAKLAPYICQKNYISPTDLLEAIKKWDPKNFPIYQ
jgi:hypothetical protein